jgi:NADH:ubiquinone oxidoreductase subunit 4 (subunit M)
LGVILSACYLLWSYQRVFFGEVTREKNKTLADASGREKFILVTMSIVMLWMGIGSTYFTRRTAAASQAVIDLVEPQRPFEARVTRDGRSVGQPVVSGTNTSPVAQTSSTAKGANR